VQEQDYLRERFAFFAFFAFRFFAMDVQKLL